MKSKFFLFSFLLLINNAFATTSVYEGFKGQEWKFIEHMFINKSTQECNTVSKKIKQWGTVLITFELAKFICRNRYALYINNPEWVNFPDLDPPLANADEKSKNEYIKREAQFLVGGITTLGLGIISSIVAYRLFNRLYRNSIEYHACLEFIEHWSEYKELTPKELQNSFEDIYQKHIHNELMNTEIYEMIVVIKELVAARLA